MVELMNRLVAPTPPFFIKLRNIGLVLATIGGAIISLPFELPYYLKEWAAVLTAAGTVMSGVSQTAVNKE
ncbi:hypothetical protein LX64_05029 [Chitinophaga skermanii]|uniref:Uncharacterized protein n=1 Tax=Chitinophaga skermanii TaxID=331697 RepID=A0A327PZR2_9BACT|nr:hypothetical protein [Chitinophaga skermanii]RAI97725.1 hypothetical protein LX64_05029 [Chitinophaga skermanii]